MVSVFIGATNSSTRSTFSAAGDALFRGSVAVLVAPPVEDLFPGSWTGMTGKAIPDSNSTKTAGRWIIRLPSRISVIPDEKI